MDPRLLSSIESVWASEFPNNSQKKATVNILVCQWKSSTVSYSETYMSNSSESCFLEVVHSTAKKLHGQILAADPSINGDAVSCFGTLLRVPQVRERFADYKLRDVGLLKLLGHIAAADDAWRHLTAVVLDEATSLVSNIIDPPPPPPPPFPSSEGNDASLSLDGADIMSIVVSGDRIMPSPIPATISLERSPLGEIPLPTHGAKHISIGPSCNYDACESILRDGLMPSESDAHGTCLFDETPSGLSSRSGGVVKESPEVEVLAHPGGEVLAHHGNEQIDNVLAYLTEEPLYHKRSPTAPTTQVALPLLHLSKLRPADRVWADMQDDDFSQGSSCPHLHSGNLLVDIDLPCKPCMGKGKGNGETGRKQVVASEAVKFKMVLKKYGHKIVQMDEFLSEYRARRNLE
jgi:hypothetical protein